MPDFGFIVPLTSSRSFDFASVIAGAPLAAAVSPFASKTFFVSMAANFVDIAAKHSKACGRFRQWGSCALEGHDDKRRF
jgi:hypothetical protein